MRVVTHLVALGERTAEGLLLAEEPGRVFPTCPALSLSPLDLARLGEILGAGDHDSLLGQFKLLAGESQEPPWVVSLPGALVRALRTMAPGDEPTTAAEWVEAGEAGEGHSRDDLAQFLSAAGLLARDSADSIVLHIAAATP